MEPTEVTMRRTLSFILSLTALTAPFGAGSARAQTADEFFDDSKMQEIRLTLNPRDWQTLQERYLENIYHPGEVRWNGLTVRNVGIRPRGHGSRSEHKPGLRVDLNRYVAGQTFLGLSSFVIDNLWQDPSMLRERVTMKLMTRMGLPAPREAHVRLFVNDQFMGVYTLVEAIDKDFVRRTLNAPGAHDRVEDDGVIYEYHWGYPYYFTYLGSDLREYKAIWEAKTRERDGDEALYGPIRDLTRLINETSSADFVRVVGERLDLESFLRMVAVEAFVAEFDGVLGNWAMNNFYLYRREDSRFLFVPWDRDHAFYGADPYFPIWFGVDENALTQRLMGIPEMHALFLAALDECARRADERQEDGRSWLETEIWREWEQFSSDAIGDPARPYTMEATQHEVAQLIEFARRRPGFVQCVVSRGGGRDAGPACGAPADR
jgi:hypothetical protein